METTDALDVQDCHLCAAPLSGLAAARGPGPGDLTAKRQAMRSPDHFARTFTPTCRRVRGEIKVTATNSCKEPRHLQ